MTGRKRRTNGTQNNHSSCIWIFFEPLQNFGITLIRIGCTVYAVTFMNKHLAQLSWVVSRMFSQFNCEVSATRSIHQCGTTIRLHFSCWKWKQTKCLNGHNCWRAQTRQLPILYNSEKKAKSADVRMKTCAVDCVFYIRAFRGACECTWKYWSISSHTPPAQLEIKDTINEYLELGTYTPE